jgi:hypothetical protein
VAARRRRSPGSAMLSARRALASPFRPAGKTRSRRCKSPAFLRGRVDGLGASCRRNAGTAGWFWLGSRGTNRGVREQAGELGGALSLGDFFQFARSVVDGVFKLIAAGFTGPYVSDAVVGKMLRPFWLAQARTTLRTLICCYSFHRCFLHMCFLFARHLKPKDDGDMKTRRSACIGVWIIRGGRMCNRLEEQPRRSTARALAFRSG